MVLDVLFGNAIGRFALLAVIPFIIIYLRRPKPIDKTVPSLMFFIGDKGLSKRNSFFRTFLQNLLFLIQLLALLAMAFSVSQPFTQIPQNLSREVNILIIDSSASSQVPYAVTTRFQQEIIESQQFLNGRVSIILATNIPIVVLDEGSPAKAKEILSAIKPSDTGTNLGDAMLLSAEMLQGKQGRVVVLSDFAVNSGPDLLVAKRILTSKGNEVRFIDVMKNASNIGITDLSVDKYKSTAYVKNFGSEPALVTAQISNKETVNWSSEINPGAVEVISFDTMEGITKIELKNQDDFAPDNTAYISYPSKTRVNALLITNADSSYLKTALQSSKEVALTIAKPPVIPSLDYDVIIISQVNKAYLLPGFYEDVLRKVRAGSSVIVTAEDDIDASFSKILPVTLESIGGQTPITIKVINQLSKDMEFGSMTKHWICKPLPDSLVVAEAMDQSPVIAMAEMGAGRLVYYGIFDSKSSFPVSSSYPIFWNNLLGFLIQTGDLSDYNVKTGKILPIDSQNVITPSGSVTTSRLFFDKAGIYKVGNSTIAANLIDPLESDINDRPVKLEDDIKTAAVEASVEKQDFELSPILLAIGFLLLALEVYYVKRNGDI